MIHVSGCQGPSQGCFNIPMGIRENANKKNRKGRVEPGDARTGLERKIVGSEHVLNLNAQERPTLESMPAKVECTR